MEPTITSEVVVAYSQCPRKAYLLMFSPDQGEPHEYVQILEQERRENQAQHADRLKQKYSDVQPYTLGSAISVSLLYSMNSEGLDANFPNPYLMISIG